MLVQKDFNPLDYQLSAMSYQLLSFPLIELKAHSKRISIL
jgi:hypothetical protein